MTQHDSTSRDPRTNIVSSPTFNEEGFVTGGKTTGIGIEINWQDGPLDPNGQNGAFVEGVIEAAIHRLKAYQETGLNNPYNTVAMDYLEQAKNMLDGRRKDREERGVQSTYKP